MGKADLDLCYLSATDAIAKFRRRELSPVELTKSIIQRNIDINPIINATTECFFEEALAASRDAEKRYGKTKSARLRPLEGLTTDQQCRQRNPGRWPNRGHVARMDRQQKAKLRRRDIKHRHTEQTGQIV